MKSVGKIPSLSGKGYGYLGHFKNEGVLRHGHNTSKAKAYGYGKKKRKK